MGTINLRIDDDLKARSYAVLDRLGVTPSELLPKRLSLRSFGSGWPTPKKGSRCRWMTFELEFDPRAWREWKKLGDTVRQQFKKKLVEVLERPRNEANRLHGLPDCYKVKLRGAGYRLVYQVQDDRVVVFVVAVGKREREQVYLDAGSRLE